MVQLDRVEGQRGHMVINEDGTIISSSGDLASSESTAEAMVNLMSHTLRVNSTPAATGTGGNGPSGDDLQGHNNGLEGTNNGIATLNSAAQDNGQVWKFNKVTVDFGEHSIVACVSNKRIHVVKRDNEAPPEAESALIDN